MKDYLPIIIHVSLPYVSFQELNDREVSPNRSHNAPNDKNGRRQVSVPNQPERKQSWQDERDESAGGATHKVQDVAKVG